MAVAYCMVFFVTICELLLFSRFMYCIPVDIYDDADTLILVHVLFRHGDRTPDIWEMYYKDPLKDQVFRFVPPGQLTKAGKIREYLVGKALRKRYTRFLGLYEPELVAARSTAYSRTRMSCLLVLAGLFPPSVEQRWKNDMFWQPIPYDYQPSKYDKVLGDPSEVCGSYQQEYDKYIESPRGLKFYEDNKELYDYVSNHTGLDIKTPNALYNLYFLLECEETMGLTLPGWTNRIWPQNLTLAAVDDYYVQTGTPKMLRLAAGYLLKKILDDTYLKIHGKLTPKRKIYLYSGHENNPAYLLIALGLFYPHIPPFGSYLILEVHRIQGVYGFKVLYKDKKSAKAEPKLLKMPNCDEFCPIKHFRKIVKQHLPLPTDCNN